VAADGRCNRGCASVVVREVEGGVVVSEGVKGIFLVREMLRD
jgi:hypothetical protein